MQSEYLQMLGYSEKASRKKFWEMPLLYQISSGLKLIARQWKSIFHCGRIDYRTEGEVVKNLIFALLLVSIGGTTLAKDTSVGNETVLAIRNVEVAGFKVTLRDTKRLETGEEVYCTQYIAGIYTDPDTLGTVAQIGSVCQVGSLPKQPENAIAALLLSAESAK